jgi:hypothetical protein
MLKKNNYLSKIIFLILIFLFFYFFMYSYIYYFDTKKKINLNSLYKISKYYKEFDNWSMYKFALLRNKNYNQYIFGTSTALEYNPYLINEKYGINIINLSFPGAKIEHIYFFIKEIINRNKEVDNIIIDLKYHMFSERVTGLNMPLILHENKYFNFLKIMKSGDFKFYTNYLIEDLKLNFNKNKPLTMDKNFIYGSRSSNTKKNFDFKLDLPPIKTIKGKLDKNQINKFQKIVELLKSKNIKLTVFFSPYTSSFLELNNSELFKKEEELKIIIKDIYKNIFIFKNDYITNNYLYFYDHLHYNDKVAAIITNCIFYNLCDDKYIEFLK